MESTGFLNVLKPALSPTYILSGTLAISAMYLEFWGWFRACDICTFIGVEILARNHRFWKL